MARSRISRIAENTLVQRFWREVSIFLVLLAFAAASATLPAQSPQARPPSEDLTTAMLLYSLGRYVDWPEGAFTEQNGTMIIGVLGNRAALVDALDRIARTKRIRERSIVVRHYTELSAQDAPHILFVSRTLDARERAAAIARLRGKPVLVVGEEPGFTHQGGTAAIYFQAGQARLEVDLQAAKTQELALSAKLLSLAKITGPSDPE